MKNKNGSICEPHDMNEVFIGNTQPTNVPANLDKLATIRLGKIAYTNNGELLSPTEFRPMFIDRSDLKQYEEIMRDK